jgi:hypothetical protein
MERSKRQKVMKAPIIQTMAMNPPKSPEIKDDLINKCLACGIDMGDCNPRQYCGKTYCYLE